MNHTKTRPDLEIAFVRAGDTVHICAGWRPYCGGVVVGGCVVDAPYHLDLCPVCCKVVRQVTWLPKGVSGGGRG